MTLLLRLLVSWRLFRWRKKLKTDRGFSLRVRHPKKFLRRLEQQNTAYVTLRWYEELPGVLDGEIKDDVDILVEHGSLAKLAAALPWPNFGSKLSKVKFDVYSDSGRSGLSYRHMPYYPPYRARELLDSRVKDARGWYRIAPRHYLQALAYHLTYHKRLSSGMPLEQGQAPSTSVRAKKDYLALFRAEALREAGAAPGWASLLEAHQWLHAQGWAMPFDLIRRWPDQDVWLERLYQYECECLKALSAARQVPQDMVILVTREEARMAACEPEVLGFLSSVGTLRESRELSPEACDRLLWWARGGNWLATKEYRLSKPQLSIQCLLPDGAAEHKESLRKRLSGRYGKQNWLHGTDDLHEAIFYLALMDGTYLNAAQGVGK